jgi:AcrR family transcriptional regulator
MTEVQVEQSQDQLPDPVLTPVGLPDVTSATGALDTNAKVVWSLVRFTELDTPLRPSVHEGEDGYLWSGKMSRMLSDLWPIMRNPGETTREIRIRLGAYLKMTHNMVCLDKGFGNNRAKGKDGERRSGPLWWVRADWNDRKDFFMVTSSWPESDADDRDTNDDSTSYEPETVDPTVPDEAVKVYTCDYPGCNEGPDGGPFTNMRANVMPLHRRSHAVTQNIIETMARLMSAPGADVPHITIADVAREAGVHQTSIHQRFTREELLSLAVALVREQQGVEVDVSGDTENREKLLRLVAFGDYNGTPLPMSILTRVLVGVAREPREALLADLLATGELVARETVDAVGRAVEVYANADPAVLARALNVRPEDFAPVVAPATIPTNPVVDYIAVLRDFLTIAEGRETAMKEREAVIERQGAELVQLKERDAEQRELIQGARDELRTIKELIAPLANVARSAES